MLWHSTIHLGNSRFVDRAKVWHQFRNQGRLDSGIDLGLWTDVLASLKDDPASGSKKRHQPQYYKAQASKTWSSTLLCRGAPSIRRPTIEAIRNSDLLNYVNYQTTLHNPFFVSLANKILSVLPLQTHSSVVTTTWPTSGYSLPPANWNVAFFSSYNYSHIFIHLLFIHCFRPSEDYRTHQLSSYKIYFGFPTSIEWI